MLLRQMIVPWLGSTEVSGLYVDCARIVFNIKCSIVGTVAVVRGDEIAEGKRSISPVSSRRQPSQVFEPSLVRWLKLGISASAALTKASRRARESWLGHVLK